MSEWQGPYKCEKCGAVTGEDWAGEIEYANGKRYHFTYRGEKKGVINLMCDGEMKPYDRRRAAPGVVEALERVRDELINLQPHIAQLPQESRPFIDAHMDVALGIIDAALRAAEGGPK